MEGEKRSEALDLVDHEEPPATEEPHVAIDIDGGHVTSNGGPSAYQNGTATLEVDPSQVNAGFLADTTNPTTTSVTTATNSVPVCYTAGGTAVVRSVPCVTNTNDGGRVIIIPNQNRSSANALKEKDLKFLKVFSVVAIFLFFPTGIPALIFALKASEEFRAGLQNNDMKEAKKASKVCERLIMMSICGGLLVFVIAFALIEKAVHGDNPDYYKNKVHHGFGPRLV